MIAREYDVVVATGEQVTIGLLAMALQQLGVKARSWMSWQMPIRTDAAHAKARILEIDTDRAWPRRMAAGEVPIVPGFQGSRPRAASPRWAAAAPIPRRWRWRRRSRPTAATSTPTSTASTRPIRGSSRRRASSTSVTYEEMLEMASQGSKVLQTARSSWR